MKNLFLFLFLCVGGWNAQAQDSLVSPVDSLGLYEIDEVVIISNSSAHTLGEKALGSVDAYLAQSSLINMVRRGAYASEPMLNGMTTERSIVTIDGMRIFHACTDKMDPVTSYVENTNLSQAKISEGQSGTEYGGTIAGSIDLSRRKTGFSSHQKWGGTVFAGFESNNKQQIYGGSMHYTQKRWFTDIDFTHRKAENYHAGYKAGLNSEVLYSPFSKYNISGISGFKINDKQEIEASVIWDKATDVGYPGLLMDVSLAEAVIGSIQYRYKNPIKYIDLWETKVYANQITHIMDDSHRPVVSIRMDMPGWSQTQGFYSKGIGNYKKHTFKATLSGYRNRALAEMTMYPNDPNEKAMFMLTWPDIRTLYSGLHIEDHIFIHPQWTWQIQGGMGIQANHIQNELGLNSLQLFYPGLNNTQIRVLKNIASQLSFQTPHFTHQIGLGYGDRAPSVSEAYGFYLLNVNDNYDYIGNPYLKNEKSLNIEASSTYNLGSFGAKAKMNYFHIMDYIIGKPKSGLLPMNMTAHGIKVYEQLPNASILNTSISIYYTLLKTWTLATDASYRYGQAGHTVLPLIQPLSYQVKLKYENKSFIAQASLEGNTRNRNSIEFGESAKSPFTVIHVSCSKSFPIRQTHLTVKLGVENLLNRYYVSFNDWFNIPRMGRNIYINVVFTL